VEVSWDPTELKTEESKTGEWYPIEVRKDEETKEES